MIDQQAPSMSRQASAEVFQTLSMNAQLKNGGTICQSSSRTAIVNSELNQLLNRLPRSQPITPTSVIGGLIFGSILEDWSWDHLSTRAIFLLYQFINTDVDKLKKR